MRIGMVMMVALLAMVPPAGAEIYKWVDENGVTQFSQTPPPEKEAERLDVPYATPGKGSNIPRPPTSAEPTAATQAEEDQTLSKEELAKQCERLSARLEQLRNKPGRLLLKKPDGSVERITEERRQEMIRQTESTYNTLCQ